MSAAQSACTARNPNMQWRPRRKKLPAPEQGKRLDDLWSQGASSMSDDDVDAAFRQLIEETLPPDKQDALMETYEAESDPRMRYNMLLEFSSYLRQGASYKEGKDELHPSNYEAYPAKSKPGSLCWEVTRILLVVGAILVVVLGLAYWVSTRLALEDVDEY